MNGSTADRGSDAGPLLQLHFDLALAVQDQRSTRLGDANASLAEASSRAAALLVAAEESQRRQTAFLAMAAHELRRPLAPIRSAAAMLGRLGADDAPALARQQAIIERQVAHMARLVDDLLDLSRSSTGKSDSTARSSISRCHRRGCRGQPAGGERRRQRLVVVVLPARSRSKAIRSGWRRCRQSARQREQVHAGCRFDRAVLAAAHGDPSS